MRPIPEQVGESESQPNDQSLKKKLPQNKVISGKDLGEGNQNECTQLEYGMNIELLKAGDESGL
jgi:hypothetical protein